VSQRPGGLPYGRLGSAAKRKAERYHWGAGLQLNVQKLREFDHRLGVQIARYGVRILHIAVIEVAAMHTGIGQSTGSQSAHPIGQRREFHAIDSSLRKCMREGDDERPPAATQLVDHRVFGYPGLSQQLDDIRSLQGTRRHGRNARDALKGKYRDTEDQDECENQ